MTKKGKRTALLQRTEEIAELRRENEQLRARLAAPEQTDEKLRQSEERYRLLAENASDVIWITDMDLNMTYVSPSAARMLGCSMKELMTSAVSDLLLPESVRLRIQAFGEQISSGPRLLGRSARELTLETRLQLRDGMRIWVEQRIDFIRGDGDRLTGVMGITREITDRKEAEEELRTSEERSRLLLDNANEGIAVVQNGVLEFANPKLVEMSGYSREELISKPFSQLIHSDDLPLVMDYYARRLKGERLSQVYTVRFVDKAGTMRWGEVNAVLIDWDGEPAVLAMINDTTDRRRAEEILLASEEKFRALAEQSIQGIVIAQGVPPRFVYCNRALADMAGYTVDEFVSMTAEQVVNFVHADDQAVFFKRFVDLLEGLPSEGHYEFRALRRDGAVLWLESFSSVIQYQGQPAVQSSLVDISKRKRAEEELENSEQRFRALLENANESILIIQDWKVAYVNRKLEEGIGIPRESLVGLHILDLTYPDDRQAVSERYQRVMIGEKYSSGAPLRGMDKDGKTRWGDAREIPFIWEGKPAMLSMIVDITERKEAEQALSRSEERYRLVFENSPVSTWEEDFSRVKVLFDDLKKQGVTDIEAYFGQHPETVQQCAEMAMIVDVNRATLAMHGAESKEELLAGLATTFTPESFDTFRQELVCLWNGGTAMISDATVKTLAGDFRYVTISFSVAPGFDDTLSKVLVTLTDITERKLAEDALRESEDRFRLLFERSAEAQLLLDHEGNVVDCNDAMLRLFALSDKKEVVGHDPEEFAPEFQPDGTPSSDMGTTILAMVLEKGSAQFEWAHLKHDPQRTPIMNELICTLIPIQGRPFLHVAIRDITERKEAEEALRESEKRYRLIAENSSDVIWTMDMNLRNTYLSPSIERLTGYSLEEALSVGIGDSLTPASLEAATRSYLEGMKALERNERIPGFAARMELEMYRRDGSTVWAEVETSFMEDSEGKVVGIMGVARNIDERRRAEQALRDRLKELQCIAGISRLAEKHELPIEELLQGAVSLLPSAWQYPVICGARIALDSREFKTANYRETEWSQSADIEMDGKSHGVVTVCYLEEKAVADEGPFLKEERDLIDTIADFLGHVIQHRQMEESLRTSEERLSLALEAAGAGTFDWNMAAGSVHFSDRYYTMLGYGPGEMPATLEAFESLLHPDDRASFSDIMGQYQQNRIDRHQIEIRLKTKSGDWRWIAVHGRMVSRGPEGQAERMVGVHFDVTERKQAQEALRESEERYRLIAENSSDVIWTMDMNLRNVYLSPSIVKLTGYPFEEAFSMRMEDGLTPDSLERASQTFLEGMKALERNEVPPRASSRVELEMKRKDGSTVWVETEMSFMRDSDGKVVGVMGVARNIDERKRAQMAREESEERYRLLAENATDVIWTLDFNLRYTYMSPSVTRLTGYSVAEYLVQSLEETLAPASYEAVSRIALEELAVEEARGGDIDRSRILEVELKCKDGSTVWVEIQATFLRDAAGKAVGILGVSRDISERKKAQENLQRAHAELEARVEQRTAELQEANTLLLREIRQRQEAQNERQETESKYRDLVENANSIILELDTKGKVTFFNRFAQEFFGFPESEVIGRHVVGSIAPPVDSEGKDLKALTKELIRHPEDFLVTENEGIRSNGERVWISWTNKGLYDAKGRLRKVLCIGMDRTEQKRVAELLAQQMKERAAADERQRLARDLHDAVTQTLFSASLIAEVLPRLWKKDHAEGERRLEELRRLTRGALAEMRMLLLELRPGALGEVGLVDLLRQLAEATTGQTRLEVDVALRGKCDAPTNVQVAFYRVAQEALNNVVKHSGATEAGIRLHCRKGSADLTISDNGSGFDLEKVSPKSLGLRIMRERAEAVGAALKIEGRVGRGTEVRALWSNAQRKGDS